MEDEKARTYLSKSDVKEDLRMLRNPHGNLKEAVDKKQDFHEPPRPTLENLKISAINSYRSLDDETIDEIVNILREVYYTSYEDSETLNRYRQLIWIMMSRYGAYAGISPVSIVKILKKLYDYSSDKEFIAIRLLPLLKIYESYGVDISKYREDIEYEIRGKIDELYIKDVDVNIDVSGFFELFTKKLRDESKALYLLMKLEEKIGRPSPFKDPVYNEYRRETDYFITLRGLGRTSKFLKTSVKRDGAIEEILREDRIIIYASLENLIVYRTSGNEPYYIAEWLEANGRRFVTEGVIDEHVEQLKRQGVVASRQNIHDCVAIIFKAFEYKKIASIKEEMKIEGLYILNGELRWSREDLYQPDRDKLKEALEVLNDLSRYYDFAIEIFSDSVKYAILSPISFALKQSGRNPLPYAIYQGPPDTGKSTLAMLSLYIWSAPSENATISRNVTPARLGRKIGQWTYPIIMNEAEGIKFVNQEVWAMIRDAWDSLKFREKYTSGGIIFTAEYSMAPLILTSRRGLYETLDDDEKKRFHFFNLTGKPRISRNKIEEFDKKYGKWGSKLRMKLVYTAPFIYQWLKINWDKILSKDMRFEWKEIGEEILRYLYKEAGLETPEWIEKRYEPQSLEETEEELIEEIKQGIREYVAELIVKYAGRDELMKRLDLMSRLRYIVDQNIPSSIILHPETEDVVILKGFLEWLRTNKKKGISGLEELARLLGGSYTKTRIRRYNINTWVVIISKDKIIGSIDENMPQENK